MRKDGSSELRLQNIIQAAVEQVDNKGAGATGAATSGGNDPYLGERRLHPTLRTARATSDVKKDFRFRYAFASGGEFTITTAPSFYTPFTTASSFQIPTNRKEEYLWAQWFYDNEPAVAAAIEFYTDFPLSGFKLECSNSKVLEFYQEMVKRLNFAQLLPLISQEYHLRGDVFTLASLDCPICKGAGTDPETREPCHHEGATWSNITILNPDQVELSPAMMDMSPTYYYMPDEGMKKVVQEQRPIHVYNSIPDYIKQFILQNQPIPLDPVAVHHFKRGAAPWQPFGRSMVRRLFPTLVYKDKLRQAQYIVAERHIVPFKVAKLGSDERPASDADLQMISEEIANVANDPLQTLVAPHNFEIDFVGASGKVLQLTNEYELINQDIFDAFMLNKALLNGEGPSYSNAQVGLLSMAQRLEKLRGLVAHWIEEKLFRPIAVWNGFSVEGKRGETKYIYPTVKWDDLKLRDNSNQIQIAVQLRGTGDLSAQTVLEMLDVNYDQEVERLRMEQAANTVTSPDIAMGEMGNGYRGPLGGGPAPMIPPGGLGMPPAMPAGAPPDMGAAPPDMGAAPPPAGPAPMAAAAEDLYRSAVAAINEHAVPTRDSHMERGAQKHGGKFLSAAHEAFVESTAPVSGRGDVGPLPDELPGDLPLLSAEAIPFNGGEDSYPVNELAKLQRHSFVSQGLYRATAAAKQDEKEKPNPYFKPTSWEWRLYQLVLALNPPIPFYAQYKAGPNDRYRIDGAFPSIMLGLEADSETYHSSPEYIEHDKQRDMQLAAQGWTILRFTEEELKERTNEVQSVIVQTMQRLLKAQMGG